MFCGVNDSASGPGNGLQFIGEIVVRHLSDPLLGGYIIDLGVCSKTFKEPESKRAFDEFGYSVTGIVEVSKGDGLGRAGFGASRDISVLFNLSPVFCIGLVFGSHQAMVAEGAFFHDPPHTGRYLRGEGALHAFGKWLGQGITVPPVKIPGMIRTGGLAVPATNAAGIDLADDSRMIIRLCGRRRANRDTGRVMMTMHTGSGEIAHLRLGEWLAVGYLVKLHPGDMSRNRCICPDL
jgi:hypothetical protein